MAYLNRDQRREMILQAAMQIALAEGFTAMTVRRIATEAQTSTGQVHHHFSSASHLKAEVLKLMEQLDEIEQTLQTTSQFQRLFILLGAENIDRLQPYLRLWNEAELLIEQDIEIQKAYNLAMQSWHQAIVQSIECGQKKANLK